LIYDPNGDDINSDKESNGPIADAAGILALIARLGDVKNEVDA
jgi:hypothetical protein